MAEPIPISAAALGRTGLYPMRTILPAYLTGLRFSPFSGPEIPSDCCQPALAASTGSRHAREVSSAQSEGTSSDSVGRGLSFEPKGGRGVQAKLLRPGTLAEARGRDVRHCQRFSDREL
jgi:hypothetical protein